MVMGGGTVARSCPYHMDRFPHASENSYPHLSRISHAITALEGLFPSAPRRGRPPKSKTAAPAPRLNSP
jgi:hypothetical protein